MTRREYGKGDPDKISKELGAKENKMIEFEVNDVGVYYHTEKSGRNFWLVSLRVKCEEAHAIRNRTGLPGDGFFPHITVFEKEIYD